ncbi:Peptidase family M48 [Candidatus Fervidibacteria bacterium JGI MDM2 SSWTFF-3-K9]
MCIILVLALVSFGHWLVGQEQATLANRHSLFAAVPPEWQNWGAETDWELTAIAKLLLRDETNSEKFKDVLVLPLREANAFITSDGYLVITEGLLERLNGRDEIAFVIAHELAHLVKGHPQNLETNPTRLERIRTEVERRLGTSVVGTGLQLLVNAIASYYSREKEREADAEAVRLMAKAGFDLSAAKRALERLCEDGGFLSWFRSHPFINERLEIVERSIRRWNSNVSASPKIEPPPNQLPEVYVDLQMLPWSGRERNLWREFSEEVAKWFWSSLLEVAQQSSFPFHPVKRWQRHRAKTWTLKVTLNSWQTLPLKLAGDEWHLWELRMNWQLQNEKGEILRDEEQRFSVTLTKSEDVRSVVMKSTPLFAQRLVKFVVQNCPKLN